MKKILITLQDEHVDLLEEELNKSEAIRKAIEVYKGDILPGTVEGFRAAFKQTQSNSEEIKKRLTSIEQTLDYLVKKIA